VCDAAVMRPEPFVVKYSCFACRAAVPPSGGGGTVEDLQVKNSQAVGAQVVGNQVVEAQVKGNQVVGAQVKGNQAQGNQVLGHQV